MPQLLKRRPLLGQPAGWGDAAPEFLQRIYAARGVLGPEQAEHRLNRMLAPQQLSGMQQAVGLLAEAIRDDVSIMIAGDYDCEICSTLQCSLFL